MTQATSHPDRQQTTSPAPFKVFGLQRTGTNLMRALLFENFDVQYLEERETGWKHGPLRLAGGLWKGIAARFVQCIKNPYAWAWSCYRFFGNSIGGDPTMAPQFQRDPTVSFEEFLITPSYSFETPIHRWNQMNRLWLNTLPADRTIVVRQEDLLGDQMKILQEAEHKLQLRRRSADLHPIDQRVDVDVKFSGTMNRDYYLDRQYMAAYSPLMLERVNQFIDWQLMKQLGYEKELWTLEERQIGPMNLQVRPCTVDAAEAWQAAGDPLRLLNIKQRGDDIDVIVDCDAGIGASVLFAKGLWPQGRVLAYEPCPQKFRLLRINTRRFADVRVVRAAVTDGSQPQVDSAAACPWQEYGRVAADASEANARVVAVGLEQILKEVPEIHLLKLPCPSMAGPMLRHAVETRMIKHIRWICGQIDSEPTDERSLELLGQTHAVETWTTPAGRFIAARRK